MHARLGHVQTVGEATGVTGKEAESQVTTAVIVEGAAEVTRGERVAEDSVVTVMALGDSLDLGVTKGVIGVGGIKLFLVLHSGSISLASFGLCYPPLHIYRSSHLIHLPLIKCVLTTL